MPSRKPTDRRTRQKHTITALALALVAGGIVVVLLLDRVWLPLRLLIGLGDIIAGAGLLVLVRQKFGKK